MICPTHLFSSLSAASLCLQTWFLRCQEDSDCIFTEDWKRLHGRPLTTWMKTTEMTKTHKPMFDWSSEHGSEPATRSAVGCDALLVVQARNDDDDDNVDDNDDDDVIVLSVMPNIPFRVLSAHTAAYQCTSADGSDLGHQWRSLMSSQQLWLTGRTTLKLENYPIYHETSCVTGAVFCYTLEIQLDLENVNLSLIYP